MPAARVLLPPFPAPPRAAGARQISLVNPWAWKSHYPPSLTRGLPPIWAEGASPKCHRSYRDLPSWQ